MLINVKLIEAYCRHIAMLSRLYNFLEQPQRRAQAPNTQDWGKSVTDTLPSKTIAILNPMWVPTPLFSYSETPTPTALHS